MIAETTSRQRNSSIVFRRTPERKLQKSTSKIEPRTLVYNFTKYEIRI